MGLREVELSGMEWRGERLFKTGDYTKELEIYDNLEPAERKEFRRSAKRRDSPGKELEEYRKYVGLPEKKLNIEQLIPKKYTIIDCVSDIALIMGLTLLADGTGLVDVTNLSPVLSWVVEVPLGFASASIGGIFRYFSAFNRIYDHPRNHYLRKLDQIEDYNGKASIPHIDFWRR